MKGPRLELRGRGLGLLLCGWLLSGCAGGGRLGGGDVSEVHLFGVPVALNLDGAPGPDGIGVRIYASGPSMARGIEVRQGVLEVLMFDGTVDPAAVRTARPAKVWTLDAAALRPYAAETSLGIGYQLALRWDSSQPSNAVVTVAARYRTPGGRELWSAANTVSVALK